MICSHCGKVLDNEKLSFCIYCGYPLKGSRVGFFAKSEKTGTSRAEELTRTEMSQQAAPAPAPVPEPAPVSQPMAAAQPAPQMPGVQPAMPQMAAVMPAAQPAMPQMAAQPVMPSMPGAVPQMGAVQPMMQPMPGAVPQMNPAQPMLSGMPAPMPQQPMQGAELGVPQMAYGMPQMAYGMPQMGYTMPQFAGYDAAGNPIYMQMVPQLMGYDTYGNPVYNMVAMPYVIPAMQGMPGVVPMQPQPAVTAYQPEHVIDVPQDQIRPAEPTVIPAMQAAPVQPAAMQSVPVQPAPVQSVPVQSAPVQSVPVQAAPVQQTPVQAEAPLQQPPVEHRVEIASAADIPMDAEALMNADEETAMPQELPDEEALLDSIFSDEPKSYSMSSGTVPSAATFSINVSASDIISVRDEETPAPETARPKKQAASKAEKAEKKQAAAKSEKSGKAASKKKQAVKKPPATIVSPDEFFNDKPNARRDTLNVSELDQLDDEQLAARLATMQSTTGGKKSTRSMKAASREEMDVSNMNEEDLLGSSNSAMLH